VRVLLPVEEVLLGRDVERVAQHRRAAMRRRPQADLVRTNAYVPVEAVAGLVRKRDTSSHFSPEGPSRGTDAPPWGRRARRACGSSCPVGVRELREDAAQAFAPLRV